MKIMLLLCLVLLPADAFAYIDPGTGSFIVQVIIGTILSASFAIRMYWTKLKLFFFGRNQSSDVNSNVKEDLLDNEKI